ncbi:MAG: transcription elongation factor GreAB [Deltaproteobacteria bacterium]|nr:transcription elongation factor GreAB [Deltaproteobacteria bacterium]MBN2674000.1 transcription elongation factor GreAB [Deltaproteobacteria bacterium]
MDKRELHHQLIQQVSTDLEKARAAAMAAAEGATHEENKAEGRKDMRATEAAYLARGQTLRVEALEDALLRIRQVPLRRFSEDTPIAAGALIQLTDEQDSPRWVFLMPAAAGVELHDGQNIITTITTRSPLGRELVEKLLGDEIEIYLGESLQFFEITELL